MIQNISKESGCGIDSSAATASSHRQKSFSKAMKARTFWPFTVNPSREAQPLAENRLRELASSGSFVT